VLRVPCLEVQGTQQQLAAVRHREDLIQRFTIEVQLSEILLDGHIHAHLGVNIRADLGVGPDSFDYRFLHYFLLFETSA
jgi:hypothetical protein